MLSLELTLPVMDQTMRFIEQSIGNVHLGDNSNANIGIFNNSNLEQPNSLQALFFKEMRNQLHAISEPSHNTCAWIFDEMVFQNFWNTRCGLLWVKGRPGAGKSTIMKYAMSRLMPVAGSNYRAVAAFFCHARGVELQRTQSGVFRALLHQLVQHSPELEKKLETTFQERCRSEGPHDSKWRWTEFELKVLLREYVLALCRNTEVHLLIDAVDECGDDNAEQLLDFFQTLTNVSGEEHCGNLKVFVSSRHYPVVRKAIPHVIIVDGQNIADIQRHIAYKLRCVRDERNFTKLISAIASKAGGLFLWADLVVSRVVKSLEHNRSLTSILRQIDETPKELFSLYRQIVLSYIADAANDVQDKDRFRRLFQLVSLAKEPLSLQALQHALSIHVPSQHLPRRTHIDDFDNEEIDIQYLSCGLLCLNEVPRCSGANHPDLSVQFIHQSLQDYFVDGDGLRDVSCHESHQVILNADLDVMELCYQCVSQRHDETLTPSSHPFLDYSLRYLFRHAKDAGQHSQDDVIKILNWPAENCVVRLLALQHRMYPEISNYLYDTESLLHVAAYFDDPALVASVLRLSPSLWINEKRGRWQQTALHCAAEMGHIGVVNQLIEIERVSKRRRLRNLDMNAHDCSGETPLMVAIRGNHATVVERLVKVKSVRVNPRFLPVFWSSRKSLSRKQTPLQTALSHFHTATARVLINNGADLMVKDGKGRTILDRVLRNALSLPSPRSEEMFDLFWTILPRVQDHLLLPDIFNDSETTLKYGLSSEKSAYFLRGMIARDINPVNLRYGGQTWLSYLPTVPDTDTLELVLGLPDVDPNSKDLPGGLLIFRLSSIDGCPIRTMKTLLDHPKTDVSLRNRKGQTVLMCAVGTGSPQMVKLLLEDGRFSISAKDDRNNCALDYAIRSRDQYQAGVDGNFDGRYFDLRVHRKGWSLALQEAEEIVTLLEST